MSVQVALVAKQFAAFRTFEQKEIQLAEDVGLERVATGRPMKKFFDLWIPALVTGTVRLRFSRLQIWIRQCFGSALT
jgi:hypothetical protein